MAGFLLAEHRLVQDVWLHWRVKRANFDAWCGFTHQRSWFPADPALEDPLTWVARAQLCGDHSSARAELDRWSAGRERDRETLAQLRYRLAELGDYAAAAQVQGDLLALATNRDAERRRIDAMMSAEPPAQS